MACVFFLKATAGSLALGEVVAFLRQNQTGSLAVLHWIKTSFNDPLEIFIVHRMRGERGEGEKERERARSPLHGRDAPNTNTLRSVAGYRLCSGAFTGVEY